MPVLNRIAALAPEAREWRQHLHRHPELEYDLPVTAAYVASRLREFGVDELHEGIAQSGIVAIIKGQAPGPTIALRADMDALPVTELTGAAHASGTPGRMHACGHDGHTAMLLTAAKYLAETRRFAGRVALIFQPAEEEGAGALAMVRAGVLDRFGVTQIYAIHNGPNLPFGQFRTCPGPMMAAVDTLSVTLTGRGGHAAIPHETVDPVIATVGMVGAIQSILTRNLNPQDEAVISVTQIHAGTVSNVIPETAMFQATIRSFDPEVRQMLKDRLFAIVEGHAAAYGVSARIDYDWGYPPTVNDPDSVAFAAAVAREIVGADAVDTDGGRQMGAEDFAYMLEARPGAYFFLGTGPGAGLHHPKFDFNDEVTPIGASFFARLVERAQPLG